MKKLIPALVLALGVGAAPAFATPVFSVGGYQGPMTIKFKDFESLTNGQTQGSLNFGTVNITNITDLIGNNLWTSGGSNGYLTGVFNGITITGVTNNLDGTVSTTNSGGHLDIYLSSTQIDPTQGTLGYGAGGCAVGGLCYHTVTDTADGALFLSLDFASGADLLGSTLVGTFNTSTYPTSGSAHGFLDVVGGSHASMFDTNGQTTALGTATDLQLDNTFCPNGNANCQAGTPIGDWQLLSDDPVRGRIPEPGTLALLGLGLFGVYMSTRRRNQA